MFFSFNRGWWFLTRTTGVRHGQIELPLCVVSLPVSLSLCALSLPVSLSPCQYSSKWTQRSAAKCRSGWRFLEAGRNAT